MQDFFGGSFRCAQGIFNRVFGQFLKIWKSVLVEPETAKTMQTLMRNNVVTTYGDIRFPGLTVCGKTGTAEVGDGTSHAWFTGFLLDEDHPYAFIVFVENGGGGLSVATPIANTVLQALVRRGTDMEY